MQFGDEPTAEAVLWLDTLSFNSAISELQGAVQYLADLCQETSTKHPQVVARVATTFGIVDTYKNSLEGCMALHGCSYVLFLEDDRCAVCHMLCAQQSGLCCSVDCQGHSLSSAAVVPCCRPLDPDRIYHSYAQIADVMTTHHFVNVVRFHYESNKGEGWLSPCSVEDHRLPIPMCQTGGFVNNPHIAKAEHWHKMFMQVYHPLARGQWGLECMPGGIRVMYSYCWHLTFRCGDSHSHSADADCPLYKGWDSHAKGCAPSDSEFMQVNSSSCLSPAGGSPNWHLCGVYMYGNFTEGWSHVHLFDFNSTELERGGTDPAHRVYTQFSELT